MPKSKFGQNTVVDGKVTFSNPDSTTEPIDPETGKSLIDPSTVICRLRRPNGVVTAYTYGVDPEVIRDSIGRYRIRFPLAQIGTYKWSWQTSAGGCGGAWAGVRAPAGAPGGGSAPPPTMLPKSI